MYNNGFRLVGHNSHDMNKLQFHRLKINYVLCREYFYIKNVKTRFPLMYFYMKIDRNANFFNHKKYFFNLQ